ncbi:MAG: hydroxymethylglutaryl-CoA lyase [Pseudomonadota bacterium]
MDVLIKEVGPRDGLQNQLPILDLDQRLALIDTLLDAGLPRMEIGSFVSPSAVPQMAGTDRLAGQLRVRPGVEVSALIPNIKGYELALGAGIRTVALVVSVTESMNQKNIRMSVDQVMDIARQVIERGRDNDVRVSAYLAVAFECPFEGAVDPGRVTDLAAELLGAGAAELVIADTIGAGNPAQVSALMSRLAQTHGPDVLACHFHDTRALGLANVYAALECGIRRFDSAIGGLGGCPFAPGAKGNVATEDVVMLCEQLGFRTGIKMEGLLSAVTLVSDLLSKEYGGRAYSWLKQQAA